MEEKEYSVSEAVRLIGVESHVLRYWEEELQIEIRRTSQGHRIYSQENIETFRQVKNLKEKGIQLKAIRVLLDETGKMETEEPFVEQIREIGRMGGNSSEYEDTAPPDSQCPIYSIHMSEAKGADQKEQAAKNGCEDDPVYEIVAPESGPDNLKQFEAILKRMIAEVVEEQNEKMEKAIAQMLKTEIEELYLQYYHTAMSEAAAAALEEKKKGKLHTLWQRLKGGQK